MLEIFSLGEKCEKCNMREIKNVRNFEIQEILQYEKSYLLRLIAVREKCEKFEKSKKFEKCDNYGTCLL